MKNVDIYKVLEEIESLIESFIRDGIRTTYGYLFNNFKNHVFAQIDEEKIKESQNSFVEMYISEQSIALVQCIDFINTHSYENLSLFAVFEDIKKFLETRKDTYDEIKKNINKGSNEKKLLLEMIETSFKYYEVRTNNNVNEYKDEVLNIISNNESCQVIGVILEIKESVIGENLNSIYKLYEKSINNFFVVLKKKLEEDIKNLKIFIDVIKDFNHRFITFSAGDELAIRKINKFIIEMSDNAVNCMSVLNNLIVKNMINKITFKEYLRKVDNITSQDDIEFLVFADFIKKLDNLLKWLEYNGIINLIKNSSDKNLASISDVIIFALEFIEIFESILNYIVNILIHCDEKVSKILLGIEESIKLKILTLEESIIEFNKNVIYDLHSNNSQIVLRLKKSIIDKKSEDFELGEKEFINIEKKDNYKEEVYKLKKDYILYELSTFEEIINYSIEELRKINDGIIIDFVNFMDGITLKLDKLLLKNKIEKVYPQKKEKFNSKEHTVLLAEKNSDYIKGEIIKVVSTGYKFENKIIIKASVVAAR